MAYAKRKKKPVRRKKTVKEAPDEKLFREAIEGLEIYRSAPFEIDPRRAERPPPQIAARCVMPEHVQRIKLRLISLGGSFARKSMFVAVGNVSHSFSLSDCSLNY